jgi:hypothetical protein
MNSEISAVVWFYDAARPVFSESFAMELTDVPGLIPVVCVTSMCSSPVVRITGKRSAQNVYTH